MFYLVTELQDAGKAEGDGVTIASSCPMPPLKTELGTGWQQSLTEGNFKMEF